jgi:5-methylcytosine-specific restriction endonuclease McrA
MPRKTEKSEWEQKFLAKMLKHHRKNVPALAKRMMRKLDGVKGSMVNRSKKHNVECTVTLEQIREMAYEAYGTSCKYSKRVLKIDNMVFDHIIPMAKDGPSTRENLQVISKFSNSMKGSLNESDFYILLNWLDTVSEDLRKDISIRLAHGIH